MGLALSYGVGLEENMVECELRLGRWREARARLERLLDGRVARGQERLTLLGQRIALEAREGRFEAAARYERHAVALLDANVLAQSKVIAACGRAEFALLRRDPDAARRIVAETRRAIGMGDLVDLAGAAHARHASGGRPRRRGARAPPGPRRGDRSRQCRVELNGAHNVRGSLQFYAFEEPVGDERAPPETEAQWLVGEAELARLNAEPRPDLWDEIAARWEALRFPYPAAYARFRQADASLAAGGARADATVTLQAAHSSCVRLGAAPCATRSRRSPAAPACRSAPSVPVKRASGRSGSPNASSPCSRAWPSAARTGRSPRSST